MSLNVSKLQVELDAGETNSFGNVQVAAGFGHTAQTQTLKNGTGVGQATRTIQVLINTSTNATTIDLTALAGGLDGGTRDFSNGGTGWIKQLVIENLDTNAANTVTIGQPGSNGWTGFSGQATGLAKVLEAGGVEAIHAPNTGKAVTSSNKQFTLTAAAGTPQVKLSLTGIAT